MKRAFILCLILSLSCSLSEATTIIVILTQTAIYIGADGMAVGLTPRGEQKQTLTCKVRSVGNCYYAAEGMTYLRVPKFDVLSLAHAACMQPGSLADKATYFRRKVYPRLGALYALQSRMPILKGQNLAVVFADIQAGKPNMAIVNFWQDQHGAIQQRQGVFKGSDASYPKVVALGLVEGIERESGNKPLTFGTRPLENEVERLLRVEIENSRRKPFDQQRVGPPIVLVELSKRGVRWIHKGVCDWGDTKPAPASGGSPQ